MRQFFGLKDWPNGSVRYELGNRPVEIIPTPGHQADHVVFIDSRTRLLFSGDFLLPGRLLVEDIEAYAASALRLFEPVQAYGINYALGAHIELNAAGELYPNGASFHPEEQGIALPVSMNEVRELHEHLLDFNGFYNRHANYTIVHPIHNLIALATGVILALVLLVWGVRRVLRARRLRSGS
jgi:glyoxylase-like metal-dependent hydrolase (beta-lactamase superfamily II)